MYKALLIVVSDRFTTEKDLKHIRKGMETFDLYVHTEMMSNKIGIVTTAKDLKRIFEKESIGFDVIHFLTIGTGYYVCKCFLKEIEGNRKLGKIISFSHKYQLPYEKMIHNKMMRAFFGPMLFSLSNRTIVRQVCGKERTGLDSLAVYSCKYTIFEKILNFVFKSDDKHTLVDSFVRTVQYDITMKELCENDVVHQEIFKFLNESREIVHQTSKRNKQVLF